MKLILCCHQLSSENESLNRSLKKLEGATVGVESKPKLESQLHEAHAVIAHLQHEAADLKESLQETEDRLHQRLTLSATEATAVADESEGFDCS